MTKKKCPQCKNLISINAPTCLFCGRPNKFVTKANVNNKWNTESTNNSIKKNSNYIYILIFIFLIIIIILINNLL